MSVIDKEPNRVRPFILQDKEVFYVIVEKEPILEIDANPEDALLGLMACYFVFHLTYKQAVETTLWFIERHLLNHSSNEEVKRCHRVRNFYSTLLSLEVHISSESSDYEEQ